MCKECGCNRNTVGKVNTSLNGKPTATPEGLYNGVGGTPMPGQNQKPASK